MRHKKDMQAGARHKSNTFGWLEIVEFYNKNKVHVRFIDTQTELITRAQSIREGRVKDRNKPNVHGVGYIGVGEYQSMNNGVRDKAYITWWGMLDRCYSPDQERIYPTYVGCKVDPRWHNFQTFAEWYYANKPEGAFDLDKDINSGLLRGKLYSPDICVFASVKDNVGHTQCKKYTFCDPLGKVHEISGLVAFCSIHNIDPSAMSRVYRGLASHHKQWTKAETNE